MTGRRFGALGGPERRLPIGGSRLLAGGRRHGECTFCTCAKVIDVKEHELSDLIEILARY